MPNRRTHSKRDDQFGCPRIARERAWDLRTMRDLGVAPAPSRPNARKSTGPKGTAGRRRAAQNARKHGLSLAIMSDPL